MLGYITKEIRGNGGKVGGVEGEQTDFATRFDPFKSGATARPDGLDPTGSEGSSVAASSARSN